MEWLLLWLALSATSLEGIALFVNEESYHYAFIKEIMAHSKVDIFFSMIIGFALYVLFLILSPIVAYVLLSMED